MTEPIGDPVLVKNEIGLTKKEPNVEKIGKTKLPEFVLRHLKINLKFL